MTAAIRPLRELEREAVLHALRELNYDTQAVADELKVSRNTIYRRMHQYGIKVKRDCNGKPVAVESADRGGRA